MQMPMPIPGKILAKDSQALTKEVYEGKKPAVSKGSAIQRRLSMLDSEKK